MRKISVVIAGRHSTSICLEDEFWHELKRQAAVRKQSVNALITQIDSGKRGTNLSSAIRVFILQELLKQALAAK
ncbi:MAG: ribbon-helix-helix domain-containing protein [Alphaproteobacteria bacterium]|nr:ribbon-helix-helix domain-containing protein [Alphaproteobacteria bacterium]